MAEFVTRRKCYGLYGHASHARTPKPYPAVDHRCAPPWRAVAGRKHSHALCYPVKRLAMLHPTPSQNLEAMQLVSLLVVFVAALAVLPSPTAAGKASFRQQRCLWCA